MNKQQIIRYLKKTQLNTQKYLVISGAAMVLQDLKDETSDIDLAVKEDYLNLLLNNYECKEELVGEDGRVLAYMFDDVINIGVRYFSENIDYIEGIPCQSVEDIISLKKLLNRKKDKIDLKLIYKKRGLNE